MIRPSRGTLAWRLYVLGLIQLVLLGATVVGVGFIIRGPPPSPPLHHPGPMGSHPPPPWPGLPPGPPPGAIPGPPPPHESGPPGPLAPMLTFFLSGLVILGVGSLLTARWIVRPLEQLSRTARELGAGDLKARTGMARGDEIGEVGRAFDEMAERIQKLLLTEKELLANVSHELRTPLARIRVALDIADEADPEAGRLSLGEIALDLSEIESLIDDILTAARLELSTGTAPKSGFELHLEEISPRVIWERSIERFEAKHPRREIEATVEDLSPIEVDAVLFRRVIDNLLENAHKYSPDPTTKIAASVVERDGAVVFEVADRGIGIRAEDLPRVFTPFFRGERSRSRGAGGVGLGLTLAKRIVDAHGGTIEVESKEGRGTTVRVSLPRAQQSETRA